MPPLNDRELMEPSTSPLFSPPGEAKCVRGPSVESSAALGSALPRVAAIFDRRERQLRDEGKLRREPAHVRWIKRRSEPFRWSAFLVLRGIQQQAGNHPWRSISAPGHTLSPQGSAVVLPRLAALGSGQFNRVRSSPFADKDNGQALLPRIERHNIYCRRATRADHAGEHSVTFRGESLVWPLDFYRSSFSSRTKPTGWPSRFS